MDVLQGAAFAAGLRLGRRQTGGPLAVFPVFACGNGKGGHGSYITLLQALAEGRAVVTEVDQGGSVPELRVANKGDARILVLDGEELRGAKQNRVLSTTILIDKHTSLIVPVSCTEQGRWAYDSPVFAASEAMAERSVRHSMRESTYAALRGGTPVRADQIAVWREVEDLHGKQGTSSPTGAMRHAYEAKKSDLDGILAAFPLRDGQNGVLVLHGSRVVGLDVVSRAPQYAELHDRLLRSYAFEALVRGGEPGDRPVAEAFLQRIAGLTGRRFKSPGLGWDARFEGDGVLGSALVYRGHVVHAAFFDVGGVRDDQGREQPGSVRPDWRIADARERARRRQGR